MADQPSSSSNLAKIRAVVEQLADPKFQRDPEAVRKLLDLQGISAPKNLDELVTEVPDADKYEELLAEIDAYLDHLLSPDFVEGVFKLGPIPLFGLHCPYTTQKLGHPGGP